MSTRVPHCELTPDKKKFLTVEDALRSVTSTRGTGDSNHESLNVYECPSCGYHHTTRKRVSRWEERRMEEALASIRTSTNGTEIVNTPTGSSIIPEPEVRGGHPPNPSDSPMTSW